LRYERYARGCWPSDDEIIARKAAAEQAAADAKAALDILSNKEPAAMPQQHRRLEMDKIEIKLVETNVLTRWPCTVCDGRTEKEPILAESERVEGNCIRVCERCLEAGDIDTRLRKNAAGLREYADYIESLIGRLIVPTYEQWKAAYDRHEDEFCRERYGKSLDEMRKLDALRNPEMFSDEPVPF
jgi:hypothetical protein